MILELILIIAIIGIFVLIVRRLPEALREGSGQPAQPAPVRAPKASAGTSWLAKLGERINTKASAPVKSPAATAPARATPATSEPQITDESLLAEGDAYLEAGKLKEAERAFLRAVAKNPRNPKLYNRLGAIYLRTRNYSDALQAFEAARDLDDTKASRHYNVALAAWQLGNLAKARDAVAKAISLDPNAQKYRDLKGQIENGKPE